MAAGTQSGRQDGGPLSSEDLQPTDLPIREGGHQTSSSETPMVDLLGMHMKEVISTINRLESLGLQRMDIPLPKCVVLGEQSAGKSSVIEAISGIKTPRSDDTCTRCPLYIKLEPTEDPRASWSASVSLRRSFSYDGRTGRGSERRFRGWCELPQPVLVPFATTDNPEELEHIIGRAQLATITPLAHYEEFLNPSLNLGEDHRCEFSPNIVCISISQPGLSSLSFYDLPGIIGQAETEDKKFLVKFVRDLVTKYVRDPESLILLCCSLETDIANSSAGGIARDLKAVDRCIGVLTKPDRLPAGSRHDKLKEVFDQKRFALGYGYFAVKNPGQDEINQGISHGEARTREEHFFREDTTWSSTFKAYTNSFGTTNLQAFLSKTLAEQMLKRLPTIDQHIFERLSRIEQDLKQFPEPATHNAIRIMSDIILDFSQEVRREIEAEFPYNEWRNKWKALQKTFFSNLESMKPAMKLRGADDESVYLDVQAALPGASAKVPISLSDDENENGDRNSAEDSDVSNKSPKKKRKIDKTPSRQEGPDFNNLKITFELDAVREYLAENSRSKVPGQIEPRVVDTMMLTAIQRWEEPLDHFLSNLREQVHNQMQELFKKHFESRKGSMFYDKAWNILQKLILPSHDMARDSLNDEKQGPYIFHEDLFEREKSAMLEYYQQHRLQNRLALYKRKKEQHTKKLLTPAEEERVKKNSMPILAHEPYAREIDVVAQVTTYYMLAARRFHDAVCMRIESKFHRELCTQLRDDLENGLGIRNDAEGYQNAIHLLAEPTDRYKQRMDLLGQRKALLQGQTILQDLQNKYGGSGGGGAGMPSEEKMEGVEDTS
ncbi:hypothetical protein COCCADRAFT_29151 [Bipolaris zeicola 26-R-13]|uniref:GED domain-containing protein n=1 Tax=Cochliobolus carbonum (strain 26-R-13) TaxID=930089 RepID=W6XX94_COCC2|nr:uncharacterized protein COCCADRAFT_29151 [Bipolaris zeicola 26-R-13]EUC29865.1 hypothetical protein COCCADRAFT_29151 [Bipolaris zeicola 26-R-13]